MKLVKDIRFTYDHRLRKTGLSLYVMIHRTLSSTTISRNHMLLSDSLILEPGSSYLDKTEQSLPLTAEY
jgi:hypothetical protein